MTENGWSKAQRGGWWAKTIALACGIAATSLATHKWILSRASVEYVDAKVETREPKDRAKETTERIERRLHRQQEVLGNVRDNLMILMDRQRIETKPMPRDTDDGTP